MPYKNKIDQEQYTQIVNRLHTEETYVSIAKDYGLSRERVRQIAKKNKIQGLGMKKRSANKAEILHNKQIELYGEFYLTNKLDQKDFISICKGKLGHKKANAKRIGFSWDLDFSDIKWNRICPILGIELDYYAEGRQENSPSFDRINSSLGYVKGNVHIVSWRANRIKNDGTPEEFRKIADYVESL